MRRLYSCILLIAALAVGGPTAHGNEVNNAGITCGAFLASGQANMAALISWLRGYHAGKTGVIPIKRQTRMAGGSASFASSTPTPT